MLDIVSSVCRNRNTLSGDLDLESLPRVQRAGKEAQLFGELGDRIDLLDIAFGFQSHGVLASW